MRMTAPPHIRRIDVAEVRLGERLFRLSVSWRRCLHTVTADW